MTNSITRDGFTLTREEIRTLHKAETLSTKLWRVVAKATGWDDVQFIDQVPYKQKLVDFQEACERFPESDLRQ